jgi:20S proteasome, alpha and beta subunits
MKYSSRLFLIAGSSLTILLSIQTTPCIANTPIPSSTSSTIKTSAVGKATKKSWRGSDTLVHKTSPEAEKYSSLPHTIFAPDGRLYNIEKVAKETCNVRDVSSSLAVAIKFGNNVQENGMQQDEEEGEYVVVISTRHCLDFLLDLNIDKDKIVDEDGGKVTGQGPSVESQDENINDTKQTHTVDTITRLWSYPTSRGDNVFMPLSVLPCNLLVATGGSAADAMGLHKKILEIALDLCKEYDNVKSTHRIMGTVTASMLAKRLANYLQLPTQSAAVDQGMLASASLVVGLDEPRRRDGRGLGLAIWRCDPTGQFWNCHAAAVGRGAGGAEAEIMRCVARSQLAKGQGEGSCGEKKLGDVVDLEELIATVSPKHVQDYVSGLSFDEAVILACQCIKKSLGLLKHRGETIVDQYGVQGVLLHSKKW